MEPESFKGVLTYCMKFVAYVWDFSIIEKMHFLILYADDVFKQRLKIRDSPKGCCKNSGISRNSRFRRFVAFLHHSSQYTLIFFANSHIQDCPQ